MLKARLLLLIVLGLLLSSRFAWSQSSQGSGNRTDAAVESFLIGPLEITMPKGRFLLVRKGREIGAIQFTSIDLTKTADPGRATYESYFQGDGSGSLQGVNVVKQTGSIDLKRLKGVGRLSFQTGQREIRIGRWSFASDYPGRIKMWPYHGEQRDYGYEFAPTSARNVEEIDPSDKRLKWFRYVDNTSISVPVSDLPK